MSDKTIRKSGRTLQQRLNSVNGNPRFWVTFSDGTRFATAPDANVNFRIENSEYDGDVVITLNSEAQIIDINPA